MSAPLGVIFYGITNEDITFKEKIEAHMFAQHFGGDKNQMITSVRQLKPYPKVPYMFVGEKDIILMLEDMPYKDVLIETILKD